MILRGLLLAVALPVLAAAQPVPPARPDARLPPDATTHHTIELPGRTLRFTAVAGVIRPTDAAGAVQAQIAYTAYTLDGADPHARPVTFATNGGPGSASAWLQLGALGPWHVPLDGDARTPSGLPVAVPNPDTWLDFTDLVFIDPAGAGWSRLADDTEALRRHVWSVDGDISVLADTVRRWLDANGRLASPKFFAGESYAGLRGPRLARALSTEQGIALNGLVLISPLMDAAFNDEALGVLGYAVHLPSMAAVAHHLSPDALDEAEAYATGDYLRDLLQGTRDPAVLDRVTARVAALTGLDPALVRRHRGQVTVGLFLREHVPGQVQSIYDATLGYPVPFPEYPFPNAPDPVFAQFGPLVSSAMQELVAGRLNWHPDARFELGNNRAGREWEWGRGMGRPESMSALRTELAVNPQFRVLIGHGVDDLITPYFLTKLLLAQLPDQQGARRVHLVLHDGGHMFYTRDASRAALHDEAQAVVAGPAAGGQPNNGQ